MAYSAFFLLFIAFFINFQAFPQIVFKNFPNYKINLSDSAFFDINSRRGIISLNGDWTVYPPKDKEKNKKVIIPSVFSGEGELVFERTFSFTKQQIAENRMEIHFLGLNYTADISVNNNIIHRHTGGDFPFRIDLPKDILSSDKKNVISVKLFYHLDSESTIPVKQRFMFPHNYGGILKDVYIKLLPNISISDVDISYSFNPVKNNAEVIILSRIHNKEFRSPADTLKPNNDFTYKVRIAGPGNSQSIDLNDFHLKVNRNEDSDIKQTSVISSVIPWTPANPQYYTFYLELWRGDELLDRTNKRVAFYSLTFERDSLQLNNGDFRLNGVTYVPCYYNYGSLYSYEQMELDIKIIKEAGFNSVRFAKSVPHPYLLYQCERYGLFSFIEIPVNSVPPGLCDDINFMTRSEGFLSNIIRAFKDYNTVAAYGVGSSFLPEMEGHITYINKMTSFLKGKNKRTYASFAGLNLNVIEGLDFYGIELFNLNPLEISSEINSLVQSLSGRVFISSATYVVSAGNTNGYINENSYEAQAKYFEDLIDFSAKNGISYFINSMFDFRGDYKSLVSGYSDENIYRIGILGENRTTDRLGYKIIYAKLHNTEVPTIPIGSKKDNAPMIFILFGLAVALLVGVLVNSGRKFREDASRALLRPYNFYADVRDQRIMSGYHATVLALIVSTVSALLLSNLLFYFRQSVKFEKLLLSFGSRSIMDTVSYLAWNPVEALLWLTIISLAALLIITLFVKLGSFFVRNRVYMSGIYYVVVWSFLPLVLLIPVGIILFRILDAEYTNMYVFLGLLLFTLWILYRLLKGIYVIFDVNPGSVYFYSFVVILVVLGGVVIYYEITNSVISYLTFTIKQYKLFG